MINLNSNPSIIINHNSRKFKYIFIGNNFYENLEKLFANNLYININNDKNFPQNLCKCEKIWQKF